MVSKSNLVSGRRLVDTWRGWPYVGTLLSTIELIDALAAHVVDVVGGRIVGSWIELVAISMQSESCIAGWRD